MNILIVAPHPDDEVLGAGGTILRYKSEGYKVAWLIVTSISLDLGWEHQQVEKRETEIKKIEGFFNFDKTYNLALPTTKLDTIPIGNIINKVSLVIKDFMPNEVIIPHFGDIHTDHQIVHKAMLSATKSFRYPFIKRILSYETLSETGFGLNPFNQFIPNVFIDISNYIDLKIEAMQIYASEIGKFPFPRSKDSIRSLALYRGTSAGFKAAEAFQLLKEKY